MTEMELRRSYILKHDNRCKVRRGEKYAKFGYLDITGNAKMTQQEWRKFERV